MSIEENKAIVRRWFDAWNKGNLEAMEECYAPDRREADKEYLKNTFSSWYGAFSDFCYIVDALIAEEDRVAVSTRFTGTHDGLFQWSTYGPWPATGRHMAGREMFFFGLIDGKIAEMTATWNPVDFMQQLGVSLAVTQAAS